MTEILSGSLSTGYAVVGLFFLRFWSASRDRLFLLFSLAFFILSVQRLALALTDPTLEAAGPFYAVRLLAYLIILAAILDKNRR